MFSRINVSFMTQYYKKISLLRHLKIVLPDAFMCAHSEKNCNIPLSLSSLPPLYEISREIRDWLMGEEIRGSILGLTDILNSFRH